MENIEIPKLYKQYFVDKSEERKNLFKKLVELYKPRKDYIREVLYISRLLSIYKR
jgi:hypothetical protein